MLQIKTLIHQEKVPLNYREKFLDKIISICDELEIDPNWLMQVINFESAGTFSPSIQNPITKATGFIQFMPKTAKGLGTSIDELKSMTAEKQLDYVRKYFLPYKGKMKSYFDLYFAVFFPLAIGKADDFILKTSKLSASLIAEQNRSFDVNRDNQITVGEVKSVMLKRVPVDWLGIFNQKKKCSL